MRGGSTQSGLRLILLIVKANVDAGLGGGELGRAPVGVPASDPYQSLTAGQ